WEGCPSTERALAELREALVDVGLGDAEIRTREIDTDADAERAGFRGSPTILIDGEAFAGADGDEIGPGCRVYRRRGGRIGALPALLLRRDEGSRGQGGLADAVPLRPDAGGRTRVRRQDHSGPVRGRLRGTPGLSRRARLRLRRPGPAGAVAARRARRGTRRRAARARGDQTSRLLDQVEGVGSPRP